MRTPVAMALIGILAFGATSGCAMEQKKNLNALQDSGRINCATADGDPRILQSEKANGAQRIAEIEQSCGIH